MFFDQSNLFHNVRELYLSASSAQFCCTSASGWLTRSKGTRLIICLFSPTVITGHYEPSTVLTAHCEQLTALQAMVNRPLLLQAIVSRQFFRQCNHYDRKATGTECHSPTHLGSSAAAPVICCTVTEETVLKYPSNFLIYTLMHWTKI